MAKQTINPGTAPTGAGGDTFRSGSAKLQANDDELYNQLGATAQGVLPAALPISKGGTGATTAAAARTNLGLGTAATRNVGTSTGNVMQVGDFGVGSAGVNLNLNANTTVAEYADLVSNLNSGNYSHTDVIGELNTATSNYPRATYTPLIFSRSQYNIGLGFYGDYVSNSVGVIITRRTGNVLGSYSIAKLYSTSNTTKDANGFIKAASPVVDLYSDHIELNEEAKLQDILFDRLGVGDYLIKGSSGFAQDGWYIETPKDANGNVLFSVVYQQLENNDISIKTYKKKFDIETASIVADLQQPVDITDERFISLRLQELPQPEIEVTDDPEQ